jgi:16S rRNA (adenine1518-N6/adenine1519-N6)-dimethyltransferase
VTGRRGGDPSLPPTLKRLGQHFLSDVRILRRIADALELTGAETVLEIGPGRGALTDVLAERARRLVAIELDRALAELLRQRYADRPQVEIVERDVLETDLAALAGGPYVLVGNVPYYITTPILFHALRPPAPRRAVYLVQREVAERMVAAPGSAAYGALSVNVQASAEARLLFGVPPGAFRPPPKVDSAVVRLEPRERPLAAEAEVEPLRRLVQAAFGLRRKQMRRVLRTVRGLDAAAAEAALEAAAIAPDARPETLAPEAFVRLLRVVGGEEAGARNQEPGTRN